jgi:hypothetical protein
MVSLVAQSTALGCCTFELHAWEPRLCWRRSSALWRLRRHTRHPYRCVGSAVYTVLQALQRLLHAFDRKFSKTRVAGA